MLTSDNGFGTVKNDIGTRKGRNYIMVNETKIRCFICLADTLSFTETAHRLYMTQQGVSKNISRIEDSLGFALFVRSKRSVALTPEGERCYTVFKSFLREYDEFLLEARQGRLKSAQRIRIGYQNWLDFGPAPGRALEKIKEGVPNLELIVERQSPGILTLRLLEDELDIILVHERFVQKSERTKSLLLAQMPMVLMVSKDHPLAAEGATAETFRNEPFLIDAFENETTSDTLARAHQECHRFGLTPERIVIVPNRDSIYTAAEFGQGIIIGTAMSRWQKPFNVYPTSVMESLLCVWRNEEDSGAFEAYAHCLQEEYRNINRQRDDRR